VIDIGSILQSEKLQNGVNSVGMVIPVFGINRWLFKTKLCLENSRKITLIYNVTTLQSAVLVVSGRSTKYKNRIER